MDFSDIFNLLIVGAVVVGPMLAKMKLNKSKASGLGSSDAGTGLRKPVPSKQDVSTRSATTKTTVPGQRTVRSRPIKPAKAKPPKAANAAKPKRRLEETALPVPSTVVGSEVAEPQVAPTPRVTGQPRRRRWTTLQQAVILREMLDRPIALREGDRL